MANLPPSFFAQWNDYKYRANEQIEIALAGHLKQTDTWLAEAIRYSTQNGGKRFRAMLVYASGHCFGARPSSLDAMAVSIELIHAYSLVHDDLPAMDDDDLRRGQPSCHIQFDEATAILVGDALQALSFEILTESIPGITPERQLRIIRRLAYASGADGMVGGQSLDMLATGKVLDQTALQDVHERKTGALIRAALVLGALAADDIPEKEIELIDQFGHDIGLAFQVIDDILDITQTSEQLGKPSGADIELDKNTYPELLGLESAQQYAAKIVQSAQQSLGKIKRDTSFLTQLSEFTQQRDH